MPLIKVTDLAYGRLRAPDLDLAEEFLTQFGMVRAARMLGAAAALRESWNIPLPPVEHADLDRVIAAVRAGLGEKAFTGVWAAGRALPLDEAVAEALEAAHDG